MGEYSHTFTAANEPRLRDLAATHEVYRWHYPQVSVTLTSSSVEDFPFGRDMLLLWLGLYNEGDDITLNLKSEEKSHSELEELAKELEQAMNHAKVRGRPIPQTRGTVGLHAFMQSQHMRIV